jgi:hypothetical protein
MDLQQLQPLVDRLDQAKALGQQVHGSKAATGDRANLRGRFVLDIAGLELGLEGHGVFAFVEPSRDSGLEFVQPAAENTLHLKSFREQGG